MEHIHGRADSALVAYYSRLLTGWMRLIKRHPSHGGYNKLTIVPAAAAALVLQGLMDAGLLGQFNKRVNPPGHEETNFAQWLDFKADHTKQETTYSIKPQHQKFEPWCAGLRQQQPGLGCMVHRAFSNYHRTLYTILITSRVAWQPIAAV
jgi:hypothetical protein